MDRVDEQVHALPGQAVRRPWYAGNRVVLYNKDLWAKAGLTSVPKTRAQWLSDLSKLQNTAGVSSALWLPGQNWYAFDGFLQDEGAQLVKKDTASGTWTGNLETPAAIRAVQFFKQLQSYGNAPKDQDEAHPIQADRFAQGDIASMIAMGWEEEAVKKNPKLAGKLGWFPIPGRTADKPAATFLGGSNLGVALNTRQKELAIGFLKIALDDRNEALFAKASGFLPNRASLVSALKANPYGQAAAQAIDEAGYTPLVPTWGNVEASPNPIVTKFLTPYLQGKVSAAQGRKPRTRSSRTGSAGSSGPRPARGGCRRPRRRRGKHNGPGAGAGPSTRSGRHGPRLRRPGASVLPRAGVRSREGDGGTNRRRWERPPRGQGR
ncbi:extracellular solute-binding protein [Streptacidiphilus monticola]